MSRTGSIGRKRRLRVGAVALAVLALTSGCSSDDSDDDEAFEQSLAEQLVAATQAAGVAPRLTVDVAEAMYGSDAPTVCEAFDGELSTATKNQLLGRFGLSRRKTITDSAVTYGGLVIDTYCPEFRSRYDDLVADLDTFDRSES